MAEIGCLIMKNLVVMSLFFLIILLGLISFDSLAVGSSENTEKQSPIYVQETIQICIIDELDVIGLILFYSREYGVDFRLTYNLAIFESNLDPQAKNPNSTAKGIYQFLDGTWEEKCESS